MIKVCKNNIGDTRTCDVSQVTKQDLIQSTTDHIEDVKKGMNWIAGKIIEAGLKHDWSKIIYIDQFYNDFKTGFEQKNWWNLHKQIERHHLLSNDIKEDVDLIDVIQFLVDGVMAGMTRSGNYNYYELSEDLLQKACKNTVDKLLNEIKVEN